MPKRTVDNSALDRWRAMEAATALRSLANHATQDQAFDFRAAAKLLAEKDL